MEGWVKRRWWKWECCWNGDTSHLPRCPDLTEKLQLMLQLQEQQRTETSDFVIKAQHGCHLNESKHLPNTAQLTDVFQVQVIIQELILLKVWVLGGVDVVFYIIFDLLYRINCYRVVVQHS